LYALNTIHYHQASIFFFFCVSIHKIDSSPEISN
jgi:hypothetical protein